MNKYKQFEDDVILSTALWALCKERVQDYPHFAEYDTNHPAYIQV
jgi:hypothetical protein